MAEHVSAFIVIPAAQREVANRLMAALGLDGHEPPRFFDAIELTVPGSDVVTAYGARWQTTQEFLTYLGTLDDVDAVLRDRTPFNDVGLTSDMVAECVASMEIDVLTEEERRFARLSYAGHIAKAIEPKPAKLSRRLLSYATLGFVKDGSVQGYVRKVTETED